MAIIQCCRCFIVNICCELDCRSLDKISLNKHFKKKIKIENFHGGRMKIKINIIKIGLIKKIILKTYIPIYCI